MKEIIEEYGGTISVVVIGLLLVNGFYGILQLVSGI